MWITQIVQLYRWMSFDWRDGILGRLFSRGSQTLSIDWYRYQSTENICYVYVNWIKESCSLHGLKKYDVTRIRTNTARVFLVTYSCAFPVYMYVINQRNMIFCVYFFFKNGNLIRTSHCSNKLCFYKQNFFATFHNERNQMLKCISWTQRFSAYALRNRSDLDQHIKHYWIGKTFKNIFIMLETYAYMAYSLSVFKELFNAGC